MVISKLKREISHTAEQLETLSNQYTLLDADSQHYKQMVDSSNVQLAKLKSALSKANCTLESTSEAKDNLQKQLEITQQQLDGATSSLSYKVKHHGGIKPKTCHMQGWAHFKSSQIIPVRVGWGELFNVQPITWHRSTSLTMTFFFCCSQ